MAAINKIQVNNTNYDIGATYDADGHALSELFCNQKLISFPTTPKVGIYNVYEGDSTFPYPYGRLEITTGSHETEYIATYRTTGTDCKIYTNVWRNAWQGWEVVQKGLYSQGYSTTTDEWGQINLALAIPYWDKILNIIPSNTNLMILQCGHVGRVFAGSGLDPYVNQPIDMTIIYYI